MASAFIVFPAKAGIHVGMGTGLRRCEKFFAWLSVGEQAIEAAAIREGGDLIVISTIVL